MSSSQLDLDGDAEKKTFLFRSARIEEMNTKAQQYLDKLYISDMNKMLDFLQKKNEFRDKNKNLMGPWAGGHS